MSLSEARTNRELRLERAYEEGYARGVAESADRRREEKQEMHRNRYSVHLWWSLSGCIVFLATALLLYARIEPRLDNILFVFLGMAGTFAILHLWKTDFHHSLIEK